jgi:phosphopantetheinyl transferase
VGVDVEVPKVKVVRIADKFLSIGEKQLLIRNSEYAIDNGQNEESLSIAHCQLLTTLWSCKEAVFKWYGDGGVDFKKDIQLHNHQPNNETVDCFFTKTNSTLSIRYRLFDDVVLAWVV